MWITILIVGFYFLAPILLIYLTKISKFMHHLGAVVLAYLTGLLIGNIGLFPTPSPEFRKILGTQIKLPDAQVLEYLNASKISESDYLANQIAGLQDTLMTIMILIAIPLLLFSLDIKKWIKLAKGTMLSMLLAIISLLVMIFSGYYLFGSATSESWMECLLAFILAVRQILQP